MDTTELLKKVRKIEIKTKGLSKQMFSGEYHSAFKGRGMSFSEVRAYQYGDDVRNIDWNVTARTNTPFVKIFEEERELTVMLLIDVSQSAYFGTVNQLKAGIITEISAVLSFSAIQNNDKVGVILFSDKIEMFIPPKKGRSHILRIIRELINFQPNSHGTDLSLALRYFTNVIKKRCISFVLSDFMTRGYEAPLRIASRRHDIIGVHLFDPKEQDLPNVGLIRAKDAETGELAWLDTSSPQLRAKYALWFKENYGYFKTTFSRSGTDFVSIRTDDNYVTALLNFFQKRR
ncbi:MAG: DUF58 domain-containing protein [Saprospiraceae bacterium]|nr:DUF58 domain-containing protein [Saprospiraceae bacterium]